MQIQFGNTGLTVTRMGLGLAALGRPGYINLGHADDLNHEYDVEAMQQHAHSVLDEAWRLGVRYFDAARSYGRAEAFLGSWFKERHIATDAVVVGSKWGYTYTANWQVEADQHEVKDHTLAVLQRQWHETQTNIGAYLNLYQIHSATFSSGVLDNVDVLNELARLKAAGTLIGLTLSGPQQAAVLRQALTITVDGVPLFDAVQATWNILEPAAGDALKEAHQAGWGIIVKEALANGRLTPRNDNPAFKTQMQTLQQQAQRLHTTIDALALAAVLAQDWAHIVLSGAANRHHLQSNLKALQVIWDDEATQHLAKLAEASEQYWQTRSNLDWN